MSAPVIRAVGGNAASTTSATPGLPTGTATGDLLITIVASAGASTEPTMPSGWTKIRTVKNGTASTDSMLSVFYCVYTSQSRTVSGTTDHISARIIGIEAGTFDAVNPINAESGGNVQASTTSVSISGLTTTVDNCLVLSISGASLPDANSTAQYSSWANSSLTGITERTDNNTNNGNGGGHGSASGVKATAGAVSATTATKASAALLANLMVAIAPPKPEVTQAAFRFYEDGSESGSTALATQDTNITADVTSGDVDLGLRIRLQETAANPGASTDDYQLQYELNDSGIYANVGDAAIPAGASILNSDIYESGSGGYIQTHTLSGFSCSGTNTQLLVFGFNRNPASEVTSMTANGAEMTLFGESINANVTAIQGYYHAINNGSFDIVSSTPSYKLQAMVAVALSGAHQTTPVTHGEVHGFATSVSLSYTGKAGNLLLVTIALQGNYTITPTGNTELQQFDHADSNLGRCYVGYVTATGSAQSLGGSWGTTDNYRLMITEVNSPLTTLYRFDASDGGPTDVDAVWTNDGNAFDGDLSTAATASATGSTSSNYLLGEGTNAPTSGDSIAGARVKLYGEANGGMFPTVSAAIYTDGGAQLLGTASSTRNQGNTSTGAWTYLSEPTGGWTWQKVNDLEARIYGGTDTTTITARNIIVEAFTVVPPSVVGFNSANLTDGGATTNLLGSGSGSFVAGKVSEDGLVDDHLLTASNYTEHLYSLTVESDAVGDGDTLDFRVLRNGAPIDTYTVTPRITIVKSSGGASVNKSESVTVTDTPTVRIEQLIISRSDTATVTESVQVHIPELLVNRSDTATVSDSATVSVASGAPLEITRSDTATVTDTPQVLIPALNVPRSDSVTVTENRQLLIPELHINRSDSTAVTDTPSVFLPTLAINRSDSVTVSEALQRLLTSFINRSDTAAVTESVAISRQEATARDINRSDSVTVTENLGRLVTGFINRSDGITVSDSATVQISSIADLTVNASDSTTVTDTPQALIPTLNITRSDTATVTDTPLLHLPELYRSVGDSVTVSEAPDVTIQVSGEYNLSVNDSATVSEDHALLIPTLSISRSDSVAVSDVPATSVTIGVQVMPGIQQVGGVRIV
jgi:hypothetical protein